MSRSYLRQDTQIRNSGETTDYDDTVAAGSAMETSAVTLLDDMNSLRSQVNRILKADVSLNWYDDVPTVNTKKRGLYDLNFDLDDIEEKKFLFRAQLLTDVTVPAAVYASGTLSFGQNAGNTETVTIDSKTYTFQTTLTDVDGNVLIGATASDSLDNLIAAINLGAGAGTLYAASTTLHPTVSAAAGAGDTMDATAKIAGTAQNTIATTTTVTNATWTQGATLTGGAGDVVVLSAAGSEVPTETAAVNAGTANGAVVATLSGDVGAHALTEVSGANSIRPKNLVALVDGDTRNIIEGADGRDIYGLLQAESGVVDGDTFNDTDHQVQISFVKINDTGDDLIQADGNDIGGTDINYAYVRRINLDAIPEQAFLSGIFVDLAGATSVSRQTAYDQQGTTPVELGNNATLDVGAGYFWKIRDTNDADLLSVIENSGGSASEIDFGTAVDVFDNNAVTSDFANELKVDTSGTEIDIGVTAGHVETTGSNDLHIQAGGEIYFDDGNQTGSTWTQTDGIKLSDTTTEWDDFKTLYGEVSLLDAMVQSGIAENRDKSCCAITSGAAITAGTNIAYDGGAGRMDAQLGDYSSVTFPDDVDVYLNGQLQRGAATAIHDVYPGDDAATGELKFTFTIKSGDVICMIIYGV